MSQRFGYQTFSCAPELAPVREFLPTGLRSVDELLDGGLLVCATHCINGGPTSGASSLLYRAVAGAQAQGMPVLYLDMAQSLDRRKAAAAGVDLDRLLLPIGTSLEQMRLMIDRLARWGQPGLVAIDHPAPMSLARLGASLRNTTLTVLALSPGPLPGMQVRLDCQRQEWRMERGAAIGFISELRLTAHPFLPIRQVRACFDIPRPEDCSARR